MAGVNARSSAGDIKTATGFEETQYFQKATRELLEAVFDSNSSTTISGPHKDIVRFAESLRQRYKGIISSWEDVNPQEVRAALSLANAQVSSEGIQEISPDVSAGVCFRLFDT
ncbi:hypothetical protein LTR81_027752 [Elasticomyces elasticus]